MISVQRGVLLQHTVDIQTDIRHTDSRLGYNEKYTHIQYNVSHKRFRQKRPPNFDNNTVMHEEMAKNVMQRRNARY